MRKLHYETTVDNYALIGLRPEDVWDKRVVSVLGDRMITRLETLRYEPTAQAYLLEMARMPEMERMTDVPTVLAESQAVYNFWKTGKRVFSVSEPLCRMLLETEFKAAKFFLQLPYPCVFIQFEGDVMQLHCAYDNSWLPLDGIYVFDVEEDFIGAEGMKLVGDLGDLANPAYEVPGLQKRMVRKIVAVSKGNLEANVNFGAIGWEGPDETIIDDDYLYNRNNQMWYEYLKDYPEAEQIVSVRDKIWDEQIVPFTRLAMSAIAYINSVGSDVVAKASPTDQKQMEIARAAGKQTPPKRLYNKAKGLSKIGYYHVGGSIKLPAPKGHKPEVETRREGGVRTFHYRHLVRGHVRTYKKKVANLSEEERKPHVLRKRDGEWAYILKFIQPFWRGPEYSEVISKPYMVETEEDR